jgi:Kef-type K+ transport system membrane component KefB
MITAQTKLEQRKRLLVFLLILLFPSIATALQFHTSHSDPVAPVILGVTAILFFALIGRFGARKLGVPSVLGELFLGIVIGNLGYYFQFDLMMVLREGPAVFDTVENLLQGETLELAYANAIGGEDNGRILELLKGPHGNELLQVAHAVDVFSRYGVIFMLFLVGLETSIDEMKQVGPDATRVALIGVVMPFSLGFLSSRMLIPDINLHTSLFLGATLAATSVGITAMVLRELHQENSSTARIILGAAVLDDILGLLMLAIISGIVVSGSVDMLHISMTIIMALVFLGGAIVLGPFFIRLIVKLFYRLDLVEAKMFVSYMFVMALAWMANLSGLATIIGAFTAGLILHDKYFDHWDNDKDCPICIKALIMPLEVILVPIFFVLMGVQVKLETFLDQNVIILAVGLLASAILGKLLAGLGASRGHNRMAIGLGMLPRGEVGLVFAAIGSSLGVISDALFSAIVLMVIMTTLMAPPLLKFCLKRCGD